MTGPALCVTDPADGRPVDGAEGGAARRVDVAAEIALRLCDPQTLAAAVVAAHRQSSFAAFLPWRPQTLAQGHPGIAVLCAVLDGFDPGQGWDRAGHLQLEQALPASSGHDGSMFSGLSGLGFAATLLAGGRPRYRRLLDAVDTGLAPLVAQTVQALDDGPGPVSRFDLITGLAGTGAYLLTRRAVLADQGSSGTDAGERVDGLLRHLLGGLARLLADTGSLRRWHTPADLAGGPLREAFPAGLHNCGLAHGMPGPLALLSLALADGVVVPGAEQAVQTAAAWLTEHRTGTAADPDWPDGVGLALDSCGDEEGGAKDASQLVPPMPAGPGRAAWCYGAPGVARALWLAGEALKDDCLQDLAALTIRAVAARDPDLWLLSTPTFCHGKAGLAQVLRRFGEDLADAAVTGAADRLVAELLAGADPEALLLVRGVEPGGTLVDQPGMLDGAPGVALALLGSVEPPAVPAAWDRMFLLS